jgi:hypothetical protein
MSGFTNKPKILRGAFVEYGLSLPPLFVVFQFNPEQITRTRSMYVSVPGWAQSDSYSGDFVDLRQFHSRDDYKKLEDLRDKQSVSVQEESISFELRLDATDQLAESDPLVEQFGVAPRLATLELMLLPKEESLIGSLFAKQEGFSFTQGKNPPIILFIWGRTRVLPVTINSISITETMFSADLNPLRATVSVNLTVIEGANIVYKVSRAVTEVMSVLNLANIAEIANVMIPG